MPEDLKPALAAKVRAARMRLKLTQEELAARIRRTPESISNIERGSQLPSIQTLADLSEALGVSIAEFVEGVGYKSRKSPKRVQLEAQLHEIGRDLSDRDLRIAIGQASVLLTTK